MKIVSTKKVRAEGYQLGIKTQEVKNDDGSKVNEIVESLKIVKLRNVVTGEIRLGIVHETRELNSKVIVLPIGEVESKLKELNNIGVHYSKANLQKLAAVIVESVHKYPQLDFFDQIGFQEIATGGLSFLCSEVVDFTDGIGGYKMNLSDCGMHLKSKGDLAESINFISRIVKGKVEAQLVIAVGLSSILVGMLETQTILLNLCGESSVGKTIFSQLVTSFFSKYNDARISTTFDMTERAIEAFMHDNLGISVVVDDASTGFEKERKLQQLVYNLSKGTSRRRLISGGNLNELKFWNNSIIMSSEKSFFLGFDKSKMGSNRRFIEIKVGQGDLTSDAKQALEIKKFIRSNYGLVAPAFVRSIAECGKTVEELKDDLENIIDELQMRSESDGISQGYAEMIAPIVLTAKLAIDTLGIKLDLDELKDFMIETGKELIKQFEQESMTAINDAYRLVCNYAELHCEEYNRDEYFSIPVSVFTELEVSYGFKKNEMRKLFKEKDVLVVGNGRKFDNTVKSSVTGKAHKVICIKKNAVFN